MRYRPEWKKEQYLTATLFRVWEQLFGRKHGIRKEATVIKDQTGEYYYAHTFEAAVVHFEERIRAFFRREWQPVRVYIPVIKTPDGIPIPSSPYLFAIAYGNVAQTVNAGVDLSFTSPTVSGANTYGILAVYGVRVSALGSPTWNSSSMTATGNIQNVESNRKLRMYYILAPTTGTIATSGTASGSPNSMIGIATFYTGAAQQAPEANDGSIATSTTITDSVTTATDQAWVVGCGAETGGTGTITPSTGVTQRGTTGSADGGDSSMAYGDSNGGQSVGSYSMTFTVSTSGNLGITMAAIAPAAAVKKGFLSLLGVG